MSLLYRAIWQDERNDLGELAFRKMKAWVDEKWNSAIKVPTIGTATATWPSDAADGTVDLELSVERASLGSQEDSEVLRVRFVETRNDQTRYCEQSLS